MASIERFHFLADRNHARGSIPARPLQGGLERACLHEVLADAGCFASAADFAVALAVCVLEREDQMIWARQEAGIAEAGLSYGPGLVAFGVEPQRLTILKLRTAAQVLRAGVESARCRAVSAVILEICDGGHKADLTATRRLKLAAEKSGVTIFLVRLASQATPSAAQSRWLVRPAPSRPPGDHGLGECGLGWPRFDVTLLRHRAGLPEMQLLVEWNRDRKAFEAAVSEPVAAVPRSRPLAA